MEYGKMRGKFQDDIELVGGDEDSCAFLSPLFEDFNNLTGGNDVNAIKGLIQYKKFGAMDHCCGKGDLALHSIGIGVYGFPVRREAEKRQAFINLGLICFWSHPDEPADEFQVFPRGKIRQVQGLDRKSTRLYSSHVKISYADFCLK